MLRISRDERLVARTGPGKGPRNPKETNERTFKAGRAEARAEKKEIVEKLVGKECCPVT